MTVGVYMQKADRALSAARLLPESGEVEGAIDKVERLRRLADYTGEHRGRARRGGCCAGQTRVGHVKVRLAATMTSGLLAFFLLDAQLREVSLPGLGWTG